MKALDTMRRTLAEVDRTIRADAGLTTPRIAEVNADPRSEQKVFLLLGTEAAIAGMESLIKAAEQLAEEEDAATQAERSKIEALKAEHSKAEERAALKAKEQDATKPGTRE